MIYTITVTPTIAICPQTKTIQLTAVNPPVPTFSTIAPMCDVNSTVQIVAYPPGGTFYSSVLSPLLVSPNGVITPSNTPNWGANSFTYAISISTCVSRSTGTFEVSKFYPATLTSSINPLCTTGNPANLMNIVQSTVNGSWSGQGVSIASGGAYFFYPSGFQNQQPLTANYTATYNVTSSPNPTVCPAQSVLSIPVTKTIMPVITPVAPFCNKGGVPIVMSVNPPGGTWSGNGMISSTGNITPSLATQGTHVLNYAVNIGPCLNTATTSVNVAQYNSAAITGTIPNLCYNSNPVNLMAIVQNSTGSWTGTGISSNFFDPAGGGQPIATGTYALTYATTSSPVIQSCGEFNTIVVSVLNPPAPLITQIGPFCSKDNQVQLSVTPSTGQWITTSYLTPGGLFTPSLSSVGNNAVQYAIGTSTCSRQNTKFINVEAFVPSTITPSVLPDQCNTGNAINLSPFTLNNLGTWSGPGIAGSSFNPSLGKGTFILTYKTASFPSGLCPSESTVAVSVFSLAAPNVAKIGPYCNTSLPVKIIANPPGGLFGGANTTAVDNAGLFHPASAMIGDNVINYSITSGPCVAYAQTTISVEKFISAELSSQIKAFCEHDQATNLYSYVLNTQGTWEGKAIVGGKMFNPSLAIPGGVNTVIYRTHSMPTETLCPDSRTVNIEVLPVPHVQPVASVIGGRCAPVEVSFHLNGINFGEGVWNLGDGSDPQTGLEVTHLYTTPGTYSVVLSYSNAIGCSTHESVKTEITVYELPTANFSTPDEVLISNPEIQLNNLTSPIGNNKYQWSTDREVEFINAGSTDVNPRIKFPKIGKYQVTLAATSIHSCINKITKTIDVKNDFNIFIPTSFSPNFDGLNDDFKPVFTEYGLDLKSYEMEIFDRWGHTLFHTKDIAKGWDGSVQNKGEPLKEEVYIYRIKYKDTEGNAYTKTGHLSLLR
jgi:gliding motility-associated-like protein